MIFAGHYRAPAPMQASLDNRDRGGTLPGSQASESKPRLL